MIQAIGDMKFACHTIWVWVTMYFSSLCYIFFMRLKKDIRSWFGVIAGVAIIMVAGSRGPFLCILIFLALYYGVKFLDSKRKVLYFIGFIIGVLALWMVLPYLLNLIVYLLDNLNLPSRLIKKLIETPFR